MKFPTNFNFPFTSIIKQTSNEKYHTVKREKLTDTNKTFLKQHKDFPTSITTLSYNYNAALVTSFVVLQKINSPTSLC
jgi:hypothetical protein